MCQYMRSNSVKYCQMTLACERLLGTRGGRGRIQLLLAICYFVFHSEIC